MYCNRDEKYLKECPREEKPEENLDLLTLSFLNTNICLYPDPMLFDYPLEAAALAQTSPDPACKGCKRLNKKTKIAKDNNLRKRIETSIKEHDNLSEPPKKPGILGFLFRK